jgi:hypothetical protein
MAAEYDLNYTFYAIATDRDGVWCAGTNRNGLIIRSSDNGANWVQVADTSLARVPSMATDCNGNWLLSVETSGWGYIWRSEDNGANWVYLIDVPNTNILWAISAGVTGAPILPPAALYVDDVEFV